MTYLAVKAIHIIGAVCWFAGLFYGVRLFVYHAEAEANDEGERMLSRLELMSHRLWNGIATPAMVITLGFGLWLLSLYGALNHPWIHAKLMLLVLLVAYHLYCLQILRSQKDRTCQWTPQKLRVLNEVPTLMLVGIVVAAVFKTQMTPRVMAGTLGAIALLLLLAIWGYKRARDRRNPPPT